ncbi:MAG TPA: PAS domain-containing protein [Candidatus Thermoplasmatota archaeon]|nr:PAS domain-containing protein [Candidatus Thermoplasmatota archaeon]
MGDQRFMRAFERVKSAADRAEAVRSLSDEEVIEALAAASRAAEPLLANVLATEALNRTRRLRASLANLGEGVVALDLDGRVRWANPAAERILGWTREEMLMRDFDALVEHAAYGGGPIPRERCDLLGVARTGAPSSGEDDTFTRRDGARLCVTYNSAPIRSPDGEVEGAVVAFADCTRRKRAERELAESRQRYKSLFDHSPDAIVSLDPDGTIRDANPAAEALTGVPAGSARGRPFASFVHPADLASTARLLGGVGAGGARRGAFRVVRLDGGDVLVDAWAAPIVVDGAVVGVHGVARPAARSG